jgi:arsenate reductase
MNETGYDISGNPVKSVFDLHKQNKAYDVVIAVCDPEAAEKCPFFPGESKRLRWGFKDPSSFQGSDEEKLAFTRTVRDEIREKISWFIKNYPEV